MILHHALSVYPSLTTCPRRGGALFPQERLPTARRGGYFFVLLCAQHELDHESWWLFVIVL